MSLATLPGVAAVVSTYAAGSANSHGVPTPSWTDQAPVWGHLSQGSTSEVTDGYQATIADWLLVLPAGTAITAQDRVKADGKTFEVVGEPWRVTGRQGEHHVEVHVRTVNG